jgi:DNA-binding transcriptional LysR family regulator
MLDDITELRTFVRIAAAGSLSAASREMGLALSVVSKRLASLERRAEVRLIARSTCSNEPSASWLKLMRLKRR